MIRSSRAIFGLALGAALLVSSALADPIVRTDTPSPACPSWDEIHDQMKPIADSVGVQFTPVDAPEEIEAFLKVTGGESVIDGATRIVLLPVAERGAMVFVISARGMCAHARLTWDSYERGLKAIKNAKGVAA